MELQNEQNPHNHVTDLGSFILEIPHLVPSRYIEGGPLLVLLYWFQGTPDFGQGVQDACIVEPTKVDLLEIPHIRRRGDLSYSYMS